MREITCRNCIELLNAIVAVLITECRSVFSETSNDSLECQSSGQSGYLGVFVVAQIFSSLGGFVLSSMGRVLLDTNVSTRNSPIYQGQCSSGGEKASNQETTLLKTFKGSDLQSHIFRNILGKILPDCSPV